MSLEKPASSKEKNNEREALFESVRVHVLAMIDRDAKLNDAMRALLGSSLTDTEQLNASVFKHASIDRSKSGVFSGISEKPDERQQMYNFFAERIASEMANLPNSAIEERRALDDLALKVEMGARQKIQ